MTDNDYEYSLGFDDGLAFGKHNADTEIARLREALMVAATWLDGHDSTSGQAIRAQAGEAP